MKTNAFLPVILAVTLGVPTAGAAEPFAGLRAFEDSYLSGTCDSPDGIVTLTETCLRPKGNRTRPYPAETDRLVVNPPTFAWPMADYVFPTVFPTPRTDKTLDEYLRYDFQLSRSADFRRCEVDTENLRLPMYNNHRALVAGKWYWRYRVHGGEWSAPVAMTVDAATPLFKSPTVAEAEAMMPKSHPVIYTAQPDAPMTDDRRALLKLLRSRARKAYDKDAAEYIVKGEEIPATASESERTQILKFRLRYELEPICGAIADMINIYRIDGDTRYLDKVLELGRGIARRDPAETFILSDFAGSRAMATLAQVYDVMPDRLTKQDKADFENFIMTVGRMLMSNCMVENIGSADGILMAHFFQHTFCEIFNTAAIMRLHNREADDWFDMLYDIWLSRSPGGGYLDDGVWPNGNIAYIHVNMGSMVSNYLLFQRLFGINTFSHPWYANCADALALIHPAGGVSDGFGDGSDHPVTMNTLRPDFAYILGTELGNPFAIDYARKARGIAPGEPYVFTKNNFVDYRLQATPANTTANYTVPSAAVFPSTGIAVMHSNIDSTPDDLYLSFRSSPFGVGSHGLAEQNSFNLSYGGKPIFFPTGYKITTSDRHYLQSHKHSRARNTILADGKTQAYSHSAYGWLPRFLRGDHITYALGDASHAYVPFDISAINWQTVLEQADGYKSEHGFIITPDDDPRVRTFRRHIAMLGTGVVVIYDELEADKDITWTFQLNGRRDSRMSLDHTDNSLLTVTDNCTARAAVFGSSPLRVQLTDTNYVKPVDWLNPQRGRPAMQFDEHQYNAAFENAAKTDKMRFLAVVRVAPGAGATVGCIAPGADGSIDIDGYTIRAELSTDRDARLEIRHRASGETLLAGPSLGATYAAGRRYTHSSLIALPDGQIRESADRLPLMALKPNK